VAEHGYPDGFFSRADESDDAHFYGPERLVTHIDARAIEAVGALYTELEITGTVLDLMSSWISHFATPPDHLVALGMNAAELNANPVANEVITHDLNRDPVLPFDDNSFDDVVCAVSVDYLTRPIEVFAEVARVLRPQGRFVCTFSNRCFPTKAIRGWLMANDMQRCTIVASYFEHSGCFDTAVIQDRSASSNGDPLYGVWAVATSGPKLMQ